MQSSRCFHSSERGDLKSDKSFLSNDEMKIDSQRILKTLVKFAELFFKSKIPFRVKFKTSWNELYAHFLKE